MYQHGDMSIKVKVKVKVRVKFTLEQATKAQRGIEVQLCSFFNLGAKLGWMVNATARPLPPRERPGAHCIGGWVDLRAGLDGCRKSLPHRDAIPGPSSPQRVAIPAHQVTCPCRQKCQLLTSDHHKCRRYSLLMFGHSCGSRLGKLCYLNMLHNCSTQGRLEERDILLKEMKFRPHKL